MKWPWSASRKYKKTAFYTLLFKPITLFCSIPFFCTVLFHIVVRLKEKKKGIKHYPDLAWPFTRLLNTASVTGRSLFFINPRIVLQKYKTMNKYIFLAFKKRNYWAISVLLDKYSTIKQNQFFTLLSYCIWRYCVIAAQFVNIPSD